MKKNIPIGYEDFKEIIEGDLCYVDKSLMIKSLVDDQLKVSLFTRPRRFGKTLNLSMIRRFFEDERTREGKKIDNGHLFDGLAISEEGEKYLSMQQQYPVIKLSLKSAKQPDFEMAYSSLKDDIVFEFDRHKYILGTNTLSDAEEKRYRQILDREGERGDYARALLLLSQYLQKYHQKNTIILIDEYDVPLENAYFNGFYDEMVSFICSLFESALKTNDCLQFGIVTGCLRISKESIFTGLNNLNTDSLIDTKYGEYFGFTQEEVDLILDEYNLQVKRNVLKEWYDGYRIGDIEIYNPWSILTYLDRAISNPETMPKAYWANTSSNDIIRELVENADDQTKGEMEKLINGETIDKPIHEDITYADIHQSMDNLWNFLFFTGYLKSVDEWQDDDTVYMKLSIPNREVRTIYRSHILSWFDKLKVETRGKLLTAILAEDIGSMENELCDLLQKSISYYDYAENYYHGFLTGILTGIDGYTVVSNRESGTGRPDIIMKTNRVNKGIAVIFELKVTEAAREMNGQCEAALTQIEEKHYENALIEEGYDHILKYGICFFKKECVVKQG